MKKVYFINGGSSGSSWSICKSVATHLETNGYKTRIATPAQRPLGYRFGYYKIGNSIGRFLGRVFSHVDGSDGFHNSISTLFLIRDIVRFKPDVIHLHTLHGYFVNVRVLLKFLKRKRIKTVITMHDCWWMTGRCTHFFQDSCFKWEKRCGHCQHRDIYPSAKLIDRSSHFFAVKEKLFKNYSLLTVTCVSNWLRDLALQSPFFKNKNPITIYNGVDDTVFLQCSNSEKTYDFCFVANEWSKSKGVDILSEILTKMPYYRFLVVGRFATPMHLPANATNVSSVANPEEMARIYSSSKYLVNVSKQETFSLINIEAQLCGTPVICYGKTGMAETADPKHSFLIGEYSFASFADCMNKAAKSEADGEGVRRFAMKFCKENMNEKFEQLYNWLLKEDTDE